MIREFVPRLLDGSTEVVRYHPTFFNFSEESAFFFRADGYEIDCSGGIVKILLAWETPIRQFWIGRHGELRSVAAAATTAATRAAAPGHRS